MSSAALGAGATFQRGNGASPEVFTTIGEVISISEFGETGNLVQVTNHDSPGTPPRHEYIGGILDGTEITFEANWVDDATQDHTAGYISAAAAQANGNYKITAKSGAIFDFAAIALHWGIVLNLESQEVLGGRIKVDGVITVS
jgi:hypothetical protein